MKHITPEFRIFTPNGKATFEEQLAEMYALLSAYLAERGGARAALLHTRIYLTDIVNRRSALEQSGLYVELLSQGAVSMIEQPMLSGVKVALLVWTMSGAEMEKTGTSETLVARVGDETMVYQSLCGLSLQGKTADEQTEAAFGGHLAALRGLGMNLADHCLRTWIFVRDIDRNYAGVVAARNRVFAREGLTRDTHFIASTGIGGYPAAAADLVNMEFFSASGASDIRYLKALDYLNPTAEYGVAFERGTAFSLLGRRYRFISGTASIDKHGECLYRGDVMAQTERLFLNIEKLLETDGATLGNLRYMIVYLRDISDYQFVEAYLARRFPGIPRLIVSARVCRPEWLIEVECVAV